MRDFEVGNSSYHFDNGSSIDIKTQDVGNSKGQAFPYVGQDPDIFLIGVYGGFIQAGVGFILIWALVGVLGKDLVRANALKVAIVLTYTTVSLSLFASKGMVDFVIGFP